MDLNGMSEQTEETRELGCQYWPKQQVFRTSWILWYEVASSDAWNTRTLWNVNDTKFGGFPRSGFHTDYSGETSVPLFASFVVRQSDHTTQHLMARFLSICATLDCSRYITGFADRKGRMQTNLNRTLKRTEPLHTKKMTKRELWGPQEAPCHNDSAGGQGCRKAKK